VARSFEALFEGPFEGLLIGFATPRDQSYKRKGGCEAGNRSAGNWIGQPIGSAER